MAERALSFGSVASSYERYRPGYPDALVDEVLAYAGRPVRTALEIGAGTGKATREFAARGIAVTATEPDPAMLAELRRHVPETVSTVQARFEELPLTATYDLVFAAASLHWTEQAGTFAAFGGQVHLADADVDRAVRAARSPFLDDDEIASPDGTPADSPIQWPGTELTLSDLFTDVRQSHIERRLTTSAGDYVGHLSTVSAYLELAEPVREEALARILEVLPPHVALTADLTLHLARLA
jgi:SAM-dependent methyltransferase